MPVLQEMVGRVRTRKKTQKLFSNISRCTYFVQLRLYIILQSVIVYFVSKQEEVKSNVAFEVGLGRWVVMVSGEEWSNVGASGWGRVCLLLLERVVVQHSNLLNLIYAQL